MSSDSQSPRNVYHVGGVPVEFPYQPYGTQLAFMGRVIATLDRAQRDGHAHALLESPTGTGKSLSLLCSALAWQRHHGPRSLPPNAPPPSSTPDPRAPNDPLNYGGGFLPESQRPSTSAAEPPTPPTTGRGEKKKVVPTIYYASRTHSQISQVVREYRKTAYRVPMAVLASRKHYCTNKAVRGRENLDEECKILLKNHGNGCSEFGCANKVKNHPTLKRGGCYEAHDIEDLVKVGQIVKGCSYYAARSMAEDAYLVFCPYSYIISPVVRRAMGVDIRGAVIILDEAHNIEDMAREAGSIEVNEDALLKLQGELSELRRTDELVYQPLYETIQDIISWIELRKSTLEKHDFQNYFSSWTGEKALKELQEASLSQQSFPTLEMCAGSAIKEASNLESEIAHLSGISAITLEGLFTSLSYFFKSSGIHINDYQLSLRRLVKRDAGNPSGYLEYVFSLSCLHPAVVFKDIADASLSVILTSGTLSPLTSLSSELGVQFGTCLEAPHIIDAESQVWAAAISTGPGNYPLNASYKTADAYAFQDAVGKVLEKIFDVVPGGSLVFFPSYKLMDKLCKRWHETGQWLKLVAKKPLFVEPRGSQDDLEHVLKGYYNAVCHGSKQPLGRNRRGKKVDLHCSNADPLGDSKQKGAGFLAVCRGKVSEGIDFSDDYARAVILIGIPFPNIYDIHVAEKKKYNDTYKQSKHLENGSVWYCHQAFRALNQAAGRCIRHKLDHGAIIFLDERFREPRNTMYISKWLRKSIRQYDNFDTSVEDLRSFFSNVKVKVGALNLQPASAITQENVGCDNYDKGFVKKNITNFTKSEIGGRRVLPDTVMVNRRSRLSLTSNSEQTATISLCRSRVCEEVEMSKIINLEDNGIQRENTDLEHKFPESRCLDGKNGCCIEDTGEHIVMETPGIYGTCTSPVTPFKDGNSTSTVIQSSISMKTLTPSPLKMTCSPLKTPESTVTNSMLEIDSCFSLSAGSQAIKRRKQLNSPLSNFSLEESPNLSSSKCTPDNGVVGTENVKQRSNFLDVRSLKHKLNIQPSMGNGGNSCSTSSSTLLDKRLRLSCSLCKNPLGLPENQFYVTCSLTPSTKGILSCLSEGQIPPSAPTVQSPISEVILDISTVDERLYMNSHKSDARRGIRCEGYGCLYNIVSCPFCTLSSNILGIQITETETSDSELLNKLVLYHARLEVKDHETSPKKGALKVDSSQHADVADINSIDKFAFRSQRQSTGGWRTTRSKLRLPRKALLRDDAEG